MIDFSKEERNIIAEFVYSYGTDILIKSDALNLIDVLSKHKAILNVENWIKRTNSKDKFLVNQLLSILKENISEEQINSIMDEYYKQG